MFKHICCASRRLDPDLALRARESTVKNHLKSISPFVEFVEQSNRADAETAADIDDLAQEFRHEMQLTKSKHTMLVAAIEFVYPRIKGQLIISKQMLRGRNIGEPTKHSTPMPGKCAGLFGCHLASIGKPRHGAAIVIQQAVGWRPSELLNLYSEHVYVPPSMSDMISVRLGAFVSTKAKREQFTLVRPINCPHAYILLSRLKHMTPEGQRIFPFSYWEYRNCIVDTEQQFNLSIGLSAHSGRAVFATESIAAGWPEDEVQRSGRWLSSSSFRIYVDVIGALHVSNCVQLAGHEAVATYCCTNLLKYFDAELFNRSSQEETPRLCRASASKHRLEKGRERVADPSAARRSFSGRTKSLEREGTFQVGNCREALSAFKQSTLTGKGGGALRIGGPDASGQGKGKGLGKARLLKSAEKGSIWL